MNLQQWFEKGISFEAYVSAMKVNKESLLNIYEQFSLAEEDKVFFQQLQEKQYKVVVLTADWCGDAMLCVPIIKHICDEAGIKMSFLIRDENLELMDQYLTNGTSRAIPIFVFMDEEGTEVAVWGPRSPEVQQFVTQSRETLPSAEDSTFAEAQKGMYKNMMATFTTDSAIWNTVVASVKAKF